VVHLAFVFGFQEERRLWILEEHRTAALHPVVEK
jgi:hypothetical protein